MAKTRKVLLDVGSEELALILEQLNRLTVAVEAIVAGSVGVGGDAWSDLVDDISTADFEILAPQPNVPAGRRFPAV